MSKYVSYCDVESIIVDLWVWIVDFDHHQLYVVVIRKVSSN